MAEGKLKPALIIGAPVGFVNVVESKELIMETDVAYIIPKGRKGGSNIAAAIMNALLYGMD
jgi:precorrin-8X/cobalt-precorrin-8 methylmutase